VKYTLARYYGPQSIIISSTKTKLVRRIRNFNIARARDVLRKCEDILY